MTLELLGPSEKTKFLAPFFNEHISKSPIASLSSVRLSHFFASIFATSDAVSLDESISGIEETCAIFDLGLIFSSGGTVSISYLFMGASLIASSTPNSYCHSNANLAS